MVKNIPSKRFSKAITVEDYWKAKDQLKEKKNTKPVKKQAQIDISKIKRFKTQREKIKNIDFDIGHRIDEIKILPYSYENDQIGSFWLDELQQQSQMCMIKSFNNFHNEVFQYSQNLSLILHNLDKIIEIVLKYLQNLECQKIILDILPSLIRDCQQDIYVQFRDKILIDLFNMIDIRKTEILEKVFVAISFAFKYLFKDIQKDLTKVFEIYLKNLLNHRNKHIREFSSQSFGYILQCLSNEQRYQTLVQIIQFMRTEQDKKCFESVGYMFYILVRGVGNFLSSKSIDIFQNIFKVITDNIFEGSMIIFEQFFQNLSQKISHKELDNMIAFNYNDLFNLFVKLFKEKYITINQETIIYYLSLIKIFYCKVKHMRDQQYQDNETINIISWFLTNIMSIYFNQNFYFEEFEQTYFKILSFHIRYCYQLELQENIMNSDIKEYILNRISIQNTYNFIKSLTRYYEVDSYEMKYRIIEDWYNIPIELYQLCLLSFIRNLTQNPQFQDFKGQEFVKISYLLSIINKHSNSNQQFQLNENQNFEILFDQIKNNLENDLQELTQQNKNVKIEIFQQIFCLQKLFQILKFQQSHQIYYCDLLIKCNNILNNHGNLKIQIQEEDHSGFYDFNENDFSKYAVMKFENINCLSQIELIQIIKSQILMNLRNTNLDISFLLQEIKYFSESKSIKNPFFLKIFVELLINQIDNKNLAISEYKDLYNKLVENLACKYHEIRLPSLKLLNLFEYNSSETEDFQQPQNNMKKIIELLLTIESTDVNLQTERVIKFEISKIIVLIQQKNVITNSQLYLIMNYFCGYSFIRFQLLWETISEALTQCLRVTAQKKFSNVFEQFLQNLAFYNYLSHQPKELLIETPKIFDQDFFNLMQDDYFFKGDSIDYNLALETIFNSLINSPKICDINCHKLLDFTQSFIDNEITLKLNSKNKLQMMKLEKFLKIFENFQKIPNQNLFNFFLTLLRQDHEKLQLLALNCIQKYGKESINIYKQDLQKLITKESFKSQQVEFNISTEINFVKLEHRKDVIPLVISIMYPRLFMQRGLKHKNQLDVNRNMVYQFFQSLEPSELQVLINFLMRDNNIPEELQFFEISENRFSLENKQILANIESKNIMRLLTNMKNMIEKLEYLLAPYLHQLYSVLMALLSQCHHKTIVQKLNEREIKEINKQCIERLIQLFKRFFQFELNDLLIDYLVIIMEDKIIQLTSDNVSQVSGIFKIIIIFSEIPNYQNFFIKYKQILENVLEILSNPKAVLPVIQSSQQIILNLYEEQNTANFLNSNYQQLIIEKTFNHILNYQKQSKSKRYKIDDQSLQILSLACINLDKQISQQLVESMLDNFINKMENDLKKKTPKNEELNNQNSLIDIIGKLLEIFDKPEKYYQKFTSLIPNSHSQELRENIFKCIKKINQKLQLISPLCMETLENLNLYETSLERKMDYDQVLKTCFLINTDYMPNLKFKIAEVELILLTYLSLSIQDDLGIKMAIIAGLKQFFQQFLEENYNDDIQIAKIFITKKLLIFILKGLKKSVGIEEQMKIYLQLFDLYIFYGNQIYQKQAQDGPIIFESKSSENYFLDFYILQNKNDLNQDFFENIGDIQLQKRVKSMNILSKNLDTLGSKSSNILNVIKPILDYTIFTKCQEITSTNRMKITDVTQSFYKTLMQISIEIYAKCLQYLNLPQIKKIFKKFIVFLDQKEDKIMVKLINLMFDNIGHVLPEIDMVKKVSSEMRRNNQKIQDNSLMKKLFIDDVHIDEMDIEEEIDEDQQKDEFEMDIEDDFDNERHRKHKQNIHREKNLIKQLEEKEINDENYANVYKFLRISILIPLKSKLFQSYSLNKISDTNTKKEKTKSKIRIHLAIAIIKLIIKFPEEIFKLEFPRIIAQICKTLKSKEQEVRDMARKILCEICKLVGPYFMHFIIKELKNHLRQAWEYHILNYTIYQILKTFEEQGLENGSLDYCLESILPLLVEEIFGRLSEEKQLQIKVKVSETKKSKAFECMHILAKSINFDSSIIQFLGFLKKEIVENMDCSKNVYRFQQLFHNIIEGFNKNKSIRRDPLLIISYGLIRDSQEVIENSKKINYLHETTVLPEQVSTKKYNFEQNFTILEETLQNKSIFNKMKDQKRNNLMKVASELGEFGLKLVQIGIKTGVFSKQILIKDQSFKVQFEGLIVLIIKCLEANDNNLLLNALKILKTAVEWKSKLVKNHRKQIITSVLLIMEKLSVSDQELVQDTFRLVKMIIQTFKTDNFKPNQMKALLFYIKMFTEQSDFLNEQLLTLNLLIDIKYIHPDVYDIMIQVREKMVTCYNKSVQSHCKQIFLSFLINYPLSDKLMQNYINFLIKNTEYSFDQGKIVIYEVFKTIIDKFPSEIIQNFGEILFITFIVNKVYQQSKQIVEQINSLCSLLLEKISAESKLNLLRSTMSWLNEKEKIKIVSAAYEMLKIFVDQDIFQKQSQSQSLKEIKQNLWNILDFTTETFKSYWSEQSELKNIQKNLNNSSWKEILSQDSIKFDTKYDDVIIRLMEFIILLGQKNRHYLIEFFFQEKKYFFQLMELINHQDQNIQNQVLQVINLLFEKVFEEVKYVMELDSEKLNWSIQKIINSLYYFKIQNNSVILQSDLSHKFLYNVISLNFHNGDENKAELYFFILQKIFTKSLGKFQEKIFIVENILEFFDFITQPNENSQILKQFNCKQKIAEHIIICIIKLKGLEETIKKTENSIIDKSETIIENLKKIIELNEFFSMYSNLRSQIQQKKKEKLQVIKEMAVVDPEQLAQLKQKLNIKKKKINKKKSLKLKLERQMGCLPIKKVKIN